MKSNNEFIKQMITEGLKKALNDRDGKWGDYGTKKKN